MKGSWLRLAIIGVAIIAFFLQLGAAYDDVPCAAKEVANRSVICKCNATYCDTLIREQPADGEVITYTSSDSGFRFQKKSIKFEESKDACDGVKFDLDPETKHQTINGFGGAVTDAAGLNWQNLTDPKLKQQLINSYCSDVGIQYNMLRIPIGGSDFSTEAYAYNEFPAGDKELKNFSLTHEDYDYKMPFIKACMEVAPEKIDIVASCWSPPKWMKVLNNFTGVNYMIPDYIPSFANYHVKFVDEYKKENISIWAITTGNEPMTSITNLGNINSIGWTVGSMAAWIADHLGPALKKSHPEIKLLAVDDQRSTIPFWFNVVARRRPEVLDYLHGIAIHFYLNFYEGPEIIPRTLKDFPNLFALATEASFGSGAEIVVDWGSWDRAASYAKDIIENLNVDVIGWMDWNMVLNSQGGPTWTSNYCDSPIIVKPEEGAFYKQPMFYAMGHFAKFLPRGSRRINLTAHNKSATLYSVAALTPRETIVVVLNNWETYDIQVTLRLGDEQVKVTLPPKSIVTSELNYNKSK